ncbi:hypothetical protein Rhe02_04030 [Rhizocola hellebori]|uniref:Uncharacterized protein n=1 Tax=Rhizocola hellebori TaxID=1392758 RepID=A0A8J3VDC3_9ACTN|nr:hypothetical protein Rhe02_04030 [Rhizocola hellebori]
MKSGAGRSGGRPRPASQEAAKAGRADSGEGGARIGYGGHKVAARLGPAERQVAARFGVGERQVAARLELGRAEGGGAQVGFDAGGGGEQGRQQLLAHRLQ